MDSELLFWIVALIFVVLAWCTVRFLNLSNVLCQLTSSVDDVDMWLDYYHKNKRYNRV